MSFRAVPARRPAGAPALAAGLAVLALGGCGGRGEQGGAPPPPEVTVVEIVPRTVALPFEFRGASRARARSRSRPRVSGILLAPALRGRRARCARARRSFADRPGAVPRRGPGGGGEPGRGAGASCRTPSARWRASSRWSPKRAVSRAGLRRRDLGSRAGARPACVSAQARLDKAQARPLLDAGRRRRSPESTSRRRLSEGSLVGPRVAPDPDLAGRSRSGCASRSRRSD